MGSTTLQSIDQGLHDQLTGYTLGSSGASVSVFMEEPDVTAVGRTYPSITCRILSILEDRECEHSDTGLYRSSLDSSVTPAVATMKPVPVPMSITYAVDTWANGRARDDRELQDLVFSRLGTRGYITVGTEKYWIFRMSFRTLDEHDGDVSIYHKSYTYEVKAQIETGTTSSVPVATSIKLTATGADSPDGESLSSATDVSTPDTFTII